MITSTVTQLDQGSLKVLSALLEARTGQTIGANRAWRAETALAPIAAARADGSLQGLVARIVVGRDSELVEIVVDALLNQETSFFRDAAIFEAATDAVAATSPRPRIWCAGCAAGQEPMSLAIGLSERGVSPDILATDVSEPVLARARKGEFTHFEIQRGLAIRRMIEWFEESSADDAWCVKPALLRSVVYRRHNLVTDPAPGSQFDAIFCRNVLFYFSAAIQTKVLDRLADALAPGGVLVLGAGETVIGRTDRLAPSRRFRGLYERVEPVGACALAG